MPFIWSPLKAEQSRNVDDQSPSLCGHVSQDLLLQDQRLVPSVFVLYFRTVYDEPEERKWSYWGTVPKAGAELRWVHMCFVFFVLLLLQRPSERNRSCLLQLREPSSTKASFGEQFGWVVNLADSDNFWAKSHPSNCWDGITIFCHIRNVGGSGMARTGKSGVVSVKEIFGSLILGF